MAENKEIIRRFIEDWSHASPAELAAYFTDDGVYHNMPMQPVAGRESIEVMIRGFTADWKEVSWEILTLVEQGDCVIAERVDRAVVAGKSMELPCVGVFELKDGKIRIWRDYFDLGTYTRAIS